MPNLKDSKTEDNLKAAFAGESQANRRYLYFAQKADVEGYNDISAVFRSTAEGETGHAHGHLAYLEETGDPATGEPFDLLDPVVYILGPVAAVLAVVLRLVLSKKAAGQSGAAQSATRFMARFTPLVPLEGATLFACVAYYLGAPDAPGTRAPPAEARRVRVSGR